MALNCDPNSLAALAKCFKCLSPATLEQINTFLLCQIANNGTTGGGGTGKTFQSALFNVGGTTQIANVAHGLGAMPQNFQARMVCVVADLASGMQVGDESDCLGWFDSNVGANLFSVIATTTNIIVTCTDSPVGIEGNCVLAGRNGGFVNISNGNNFKVKIYANT